MEKKKISTIIIEPRSVLREALELLIGNHSYRVVGGAGSIAEISSSRIPDGPHLVILGAQSVDSASKGAEDIRSLWPDSKIIWLFDDACAADFESLLASQIDGCVPLFVSPETLISTLDVIVSGSVRVMVMRDAVSRGALSSQERAQSASKPPKPRSNGGGPNTMPATVFHVTACDPSPGSGHVLATPFKFSDREIQILDGVMKGHTNKVIARACDITEATVKVHMKSILRKIHVGNRTQLAIWALGHGYACDEDNGRALEVADARPSRVSTVRVVPPI